MAQLDIIGLAKRYGDFHAVRDVSLSIKDGEFLVLLCPSGCGKTTTLRMVAGFIEPTAGRVRLAGNDVTLLPPWKRNAGMVFQSYALFPHLTVAQNVAFGLEMRKVPKADMDKRVEEALASGYQADKIVAVVGAFHGPVLSGEFPAMTDKELASLPRRSSKVPSAPLQEP